MQNRYVGDIGDFGKFALLNALAGHDLRLAVVWYLNLEEESNSDGSHTEFDRLRSCDEVLFNALSAARCRGRRVENIENGEILPPGTLYFSQEVCFSNVPPQGFRELARLRGAWQDGALKYTRDAQIVFLDPDNGLASAALRPGSAISRKYAFLSEVQGYVRRGQSVVIYHHQTREKGGISAQVQKRFSLLQQALPEACLWAMIFRRQSVRAYFVVAAQQHRSTLLTRSVSFMKSRWGNDQHFEIFHPAAATTSLRESEIAIVE